MAMISISLLIFVLNALWQVPVIALVVPGSHRHALSVAALIAGALLPLMPVGLPRQFTPIPQRGPLSPVRALEARFVPVPELAATLIPAACVAFVLARLSKKSLQCLARVRPRLLRYFKFYYPHRLRRSNIFKPIRDSLETSAIVRWLSIKP